MNSNYKDLVKEKKLESKNKTNYYEISVECEDSNDGDCVDSTIEIEDLYKDELFFLVLCYLNTWSAFGYDGNSNDNVFGRYLGSDGDKFFNWLGKYCVSKDILIHVNMINQPCHSVVYLYVVRCKENNEQYEVILPSIEEIFDTEEEMVNYMNDLYNKQYS